MSYLKQLLSIKRITYPAVSLFSIWDDTSSFTKVSEIRRFAKLKDSIVGKYSRVNPGCELFNTTVGNFTAIGRNSTIGLGQHPMNYVSTQNIFYKESNMSNRWLKPLNFKSERITIGSDVWIGVEAMIMDGVKIGDGAVVGARAVVTRDVPPYAIVVGTPAKVVRYRFEQEIIDRLLEIKWWDLPENVLDEKVEFFRVDNITMSHLNEFFPRKES